MHTQVMHIERLQGEHARLQALSAAATVNADGAATRWNGRWAHAESVVEHYRRNPYTDSHLGHGDLTTIHLTGPDNLSLIAQCIAIDILHQEDIPQYERYKAFMEQRQSYMGPNPDLRVSVAQEISIRQKLFSFYSYWRPDFLDIKRLIFEAEQADENLATFERWEMYPESDMEDCTIETDARAMQVAPLDWTALAMRQYYRQVEVLEADESVERLIGFDYEDSMEVLSFHPDNESMEDEEESKNPYSHLPPNMSARSGGIVGFDYDSDLIADDIWQHNGETFVYPEVGSFHNQGPLPDWELYMAAQMQGHFQSEILDNFEGFSARESLSVIRVSQRMLFLELRDAVNFYEQEDPLQLVENLERDPTVNNLETAPIASRTRSRK